MSTAIANVINDEWSKEKVELLKRTICRGATNDELELFLNMCRRTNLDPFAKQIYAVKRWDSTLSREVMSAQTGVDGLRLIAERTNQYDGQDGPYWCGEDGVWKDVWLTDKYPAAAKITVFKKGVAHNPAIVAHWSEYVALKKDGSITKMWQEKPALMLAKCAESLALRKAFPNDLSGLYSGEEMSKAQPDAVHINPMEKLIDSGITGKGCGVSVPVERTLEQLNQGPLKNLPVAEAPRAHIDMPKVEPKKEFIMPYGKHKGMNLTEKPVEHWCNYQKLIQDQIKITPNMPHEIKEQALANLIVIEEYLNTL